MRSSSPLMQSKEKSEALDMVSRLLQEVILPKVKNAVMVSKIVRIEFTLVDSEFDALLLENNLIKKHQPRYNVLLKDDKTYPWIVLRKENFPRVYYTRNKVIISRWPDPRFRGVDLGFPQHK